MFLYSLFWREIFERLKLVNAWGLRIWMYLINALFGLNAMVYNGYTQLCNVSDCTEDFIECTVQYSERGRADAFKNVDCAQRRRRRRVALWRRGTSCRRASSRARRACASTATPARSRLPRATNSSSGLCSRTPSACRRHRWAAMSSISICCLHIRDEVWQFAAALDTLIITHNIE